MKILVSLLVLALAVQGQAQRLCYVCEDCRGLPANSARINCAGPTGPTTPTPPLTPDTPTADYDQVEPTLPPTPAPVVRNESATTNISYIIPTPESGIKLPQLSRKRRQADQQDPFQCFEIERRIGENDIHSRGCVARLATEALTCQALNLGVTPQYCRLCDSDGCNTASSLSISVVALISSIFFALKLY